MTYVCKCCVVFFSIYIRSGYERRRRVDWARFYRTLPREKRLMDDACEPANGMIDSLVSCSSASNDYTSFYLDVVQYTLVVFTVTLAGDINQK